MRLCLSLLISIFVLSSCKDDTDPTSPNDSGSSCVGVPTITYAGKTYNTIQIGNQCWLKENLNVGTMIQSNQNQTTGNGIEKYCYNDDLSNCATYGGLYQWDEAMQYVKTEKAKGICPDGFHIPTYAELQGLGKAVSNNSNALKAIGQGTESGAGTNSSGFSALLAGYRFYNSDFSSLGLNTGYWSSTWDSPGSACLVYLSVSDGDISFSYYGKALGFSVRCSKDF